MKRISSRKTRQATAFWLFLTLPVVASCDTFEEGKRQYRFKIGVSSGSSRVTAMAKRKSLAGLQFYSLRTEEGDEVREIKSENGFLSFGKVDGALATEADEVRYIRGKKAWSKTNGVGWFATEKRNAEGGGPLFFLKPLAYDLDDKERARWRRFGNAESLWYAEGKDNPSFVAVPSNEALDSGNALLLWRINRGHVSRELSDALDYGESDGGARLRRKFWTVESAVAGYRFGYLSPTETKGVEGYPSSQLGIDMEALTAECYLSSIWNRKLADSKLARVQFELWKVSFDRREKKTGSYISYGNALGLSAGENEWKILERRRKRALQLHVDAYNKRASDWAPWQEQAKGRIARAERIF